MTEVHTTTCCVERWQITVSWCDQEQQYIVRSHSIPHQMAMFEDAESVSVVACEDDAAVYGRLMSLARAVKSWCTMRV